MKRTRFHLISTLAIAAAAALSACAPMGGPAAGGPKAPPAMAGQPMPPPPPMAGQPMPPPPMAGGAVPMVGGAPMYPNRDIVDNAVNSRDHTTLVAAVKAAGLVDTLKGPGPFTVFAPTNAAFAALPAGTVDTLLKPENKPALTKVLTYHVVPGKMDAAALNRAAMAGGGKTMVKTASGGTLTVTASGGMVMITDESGGMAHVTIADVNQSNGVIHVVDKVLLPK